MPNTAQNAAPSNGQPDSELLKLEQFMHQFSLFNQSLTDKPKVNHEKQYKRAA